MASATVKPSMDFDHLLDTALQNKTIIFQLPAIDMFFKAPNQAKRAGRQCGPVFCSRPVIGPKLMR